MNKTASVIVGLIVIAIVGMIVFSQSPHTNYPVASPSSVQSASSTEPAPTASSSPSAGVPASYTLAQVATHSSKAGCWTTINGNVYDLTTWISQHPGGEQAILSICGKDGTAAFTAQHSRDAQPQQTLATFKIGTLSK